MLSSVVQALLFVWFFIAIILFSKMTSPRALIFGILAAIMFLPMASYDISLIPGRKDVYANLGLLIAALLLDPQPLLAFRPRLVDLPMILLCITPFISATANGQAPYNAFASSMAAVVTWGLPYLLGRSYLTNVQSLWQMAHGIFIAGLIYAPGCIFEMFMGPTLHERVYGTPAFPDYLQSMRWGGYRPTMFMQHGLMVGTFMCCAAMMGIWLWTNKAHRKFYALPAVPTIGFLLAVAIWCKSTGAIILMVIGLGVLFFTRFMRNGVLVYLLATAPLVYVLARTVGGWTGDNAVQFATDYLSVDSGGSLQVRFGNENVLVERAMLKPLFGFGTDGEFLIKDSDNRITSIPDGLWVIALGSGGLVGLAALFGCMIVPTLAFIRRFPARTWGHPAMAAPAALGVFLITYAFDCLMNAMINPVYLVALGGVAALSVSNDLMPRRPGQPRQSGKTQSPGPRRQQVTISTRMPPLPAVPNR